LLNDDRLNDDHRTITMGAHVEEALRTRQFADGNEPPARGVVSSALAEDAETYSNSVAGIEIHSVRTGTGCCPSQLLAAEGDRFTFTSSKVGFPMVTETTLSDDVVVIAYMQAVPRGVRWCELDMEPGEILAYGPAAEHTARNLPGFEFMFVAFDVPRLVEYSDWLETRIEVPLRGRVHRLARTAKTAAVGPAFLAFANSATSSRYPPPVVADDVVRATVHALSEEEGVQRIGASKRIDSRHVVRNCIDYANALQRIPSISELCLTAHVSERRLRQAFTDEFDLPPSQYFRAWALNQAHARLSYKQVNSTTVTRVACELGFDHLGRFASRYKQIFGESPSATLQRMTGAGSSTQTISAEYGYPPALTSLR
jgi:AraC-like DNA-binding protein